MYLCIDGWKGAGQMTGFLFRGLLIGILFGVPAGAVGAMAAQRTFRYGVRAGLLTGLGSSAADCFYACVGVFGLTLVSDFLLGRQKVIRAVGGCLVLAMGISLLLKKEKREQEKADSTDHFKMFLSAFAVGITNPAAVLAFLFAFSLFGISGKPAPAEGAALVTGIFAGTYFWWGLLTGGINLLKKKAKQFSFSRLNAVSGMILLLLGVSVLADLLS